jgi:putative peptidoglycan lipid II flippase
VSTRVKESAALVRKAGGISALTALSRVLGLAREQVFAALLGAGPYADAFQIAFRIPNLLRDLFAEGALSAAFVPTYTRVRAAAGRAGADRLASRLLTFLAVLLGVLVALAILAAEPLVHALAPGYANIAGKTEITVLLTRVMLPFLPLVSFAAVAMGMLNAEQRYAAPALAPAMFNVVAVIWAGVLWVAGLGAREVAIGWAIGTLLGGLAQLATQLPDLRALGFRFRLEWAPGDAGLRSIARLMGPAVVGLAAVQFNIFLSSMFASHEPGAVSWLNYAFRILYLPIGIFGVALGTVAATGLSRRAASGDLDGLGETLRASLRMVAFLTLPATLGLWVLGVPIVRLLYERGRFLASDTLATADALTIYALGLVAYTSVKVMAPAFYALDAPRVPLLGSLLAVGANLVLILALHGPLGFRAVALGTAVGSLINASVLLAVLQHRLHLLRGHGLGLDAVRMLAAAAAMALATWGLSRVAIAVLGTLGLGAQLAGALIPVLVGAALYLLAARALNVREAEALLAVLRRRRAA